MIVTNEKIVPVVTQANGLFKRYGPLESHEVRKAEVTGTEIDRLRARREMLRSMDPEKVKQVIEFRRNLNLFQALALAKREGKLIVPNDVHDRILMETTDQEYLKNYPVWTGTLVIYEAPNKPFGEEVVFERITFQVPEQFQGKANCALVVEHPDFELVNLGNNKYEIKVADKQSVRLIQDFPDRNGWHMSDTEIGVPQGSKVKISSEARYLSRLYEDSYIGLLRRVYVDFEDRRRDIGLFVLPSGRRGVALMPLAAATEKSDSHD